MGTLQWVGQTKDYSHSNSKVEFNCKKIKRRDIFKAFFKIALFAAITRKRYFLHSKSYLKFLAQL